jgi:hypothetical protein
VNDYALAELLREAVKHNEGIRVAMIGERREKSDAGFLWAIVSDQETIISTADLLPKPTSMARPYGVVSWDNGTVTEVPLGDLRADG